VQWSLPYPSAPVFSLKKAKTVYIEELERFSPNNILGGILKTTQDLGHGKPNDHRQSFKQQAAGRDIGIGRALP
jgi:hypothetical protein